MRLVRSAPEDSKECVSWLIANMMLNDVSLRTLKGSIFYKIPGILYLPVKPVLMLESLAPNPEVTGTKRLLALRTAMNDLRKIYPGVELVYLTKGKTELDQGARIYGFERSDYALYRFIDSRARSDRKKEDAASLPEILLRNDARKSRRDEAKAKRIMCRLPVSA